MRTTVQAYREIVRWFVKAAAEEDQCRPITTEQMLCEEVTAIYGIDLSGKKGRELYRSLNELNSWALCLSGGGIRSASFALGLVQALAVHPRSSRVAVNGAAFRSCAAGDRCTAGCRAGRRRLGVKSVGSTRSDEFAACPLIR